MLRRHNCMSFSNCLWQPKFFFCFSHIPEENYISEKPTLLADNDNESLADSLGGFDANPDMARFNENGSFIGQYGGKDDEKLDKDEPSVPTSPNQHLLNTFVWIVDSRCESCCSSRIVFPISKTGAEL